MTRLATVGRQPAGAAARRGLFALIACGPLLFAAMANAAGSTSAFVRVDADESGQPRALQLAIVTYTPAAGGNYSVDLVSAIHIGDADYYANLNERFRDYDAVLYELVAPPGTVVTPDADHEGLVSNAQLLMTRMLELQFQLDEIDYTAPNFVHADLSREELADSMAARDESLYSYFWRLVFASIREYAKDPLGIRDLQKLGATVGSKQEQPFKTLLAYEMTNLDQLQQIFGEDSDSAVIGARNQRAIDVLAEKLAAGAQRVGIFYGVGHMPDLEERLLAMGLVRSDIDWVDAWQLEKTAGDEPGGAQ